MLRSKRPLILTALAAAAMSLLAYASERQPGPAVLLGGSVTTFACGLIGWRRAHLAARQMGAQGSMFRDHRSFDHLTQVGDADYLTARLRREYESGTGECSLLMLDIDGFHLVNRDFGRREGDRVLQAVAQVLLLNLRSTDLLCRYAGDRFAILLPGTKAEAAHALADHLRRAVAGLRHHTQHAGLPILSTVRYTFRSVDADPRQLLRELNRALERRMPMPPASGAELAGNTVSA